MHRLSRGEWIDWFGALARGQAVEVEPPFTGNDADSWRLESVYFAPFDDLIEIVLEGRDGRRPRLLLDEPEEVWVEERAGSSGTEWELSITFGTRAIRLNSSPSRITPTMRRPPTINGTKGWETEKVRSRASGGHHV